MTNPQNKLDLTNIQGLQGIDDEAAQSLVGGAFNFGINQQNGQFSSEYFADDSGIRGASRNDTELILGHDPANPGPGGLFTLALAEPGGDVILDVYTAADPVESGRGIDVTDVVEGTAGAIEWRVTQVRPSSPTSICDVCNGQGFGSDRRIKTDVMPVGFYEELGIRLYSWKYINDDPTRYVGVMAQDLLSRPDLAHAVVIAQKGEFAGYYAVSYKALGLRMTTQAEWEKQGATAIASKPLALCV